LVKSATYRLITVVQFVNALPYYPERHAMLVTNPLAGFSNGFARYRSPFLRQPAAAGVT
jgi:glyoxylate utilization-related uncharacterized protein